VTLGYAHATDQDARHTSATHRLILSGTPIQNSVLELWALFDFLMPGFLGPERDFNARYGKALQVGSVEHRPTHT
jgi:TATA-binding protein-associated factor